MTIETIITRAFLDEYRISAKNIENYLLKKQLYRYGYPAKIDSYDELIIFRNEKLTIFYRQYADSKSISWINLDDVEQTILHCIYTRHHDGFVRQKHLNYLAETKYPDIAVPFVIRSLGDYVLNIQLETIPFIKKHPTTVVEFIKENSKFWSRQKARMISYWDAYYRWIYNTKHNDYHYFENWEDYPARQIITDIEKILT